METAATSMGAEESEGAAGCGRGHAAGMDVVAVWSKDLELAVEDPS